MTDQPLFRVIEPGMLTTVQDLGRFGQARFGVAPGGVLDRRAHILGNRLLGNDPGDASLEITLVGPRLQFDGDLVIALTGADLGARLNGSSIPLWEPIRTRPGDELAFNPAEAGTGARAYLCIAGGINLEPIMGSRSTDLIGAFGGLHGRALHAGDVLPIGETIIPVDSLLLRRLEHVPGAPEIDITARAVIGPQEQRFTKGGYATLLGCAFDVSGKSNRQGIRLSGPVIEHSRGADMVSEGIAHGAVQVPGDGQPIVLLTGRQTVGGYVKIATVIGADLDAFAQLRPGSHVRFEEIDLAEATAVTASYRSHLVSTEIVERSRNYPGIQPRAESTDRLESEIQTMAGNWDPDGVIRVIEAWERSGATRLSLEVAQSGLRLDLQKDAQPVVISNPVPFDRPAPQLDQNSTGIEVKAPVLGIFFRRSAPELPNLAEIGSAVEAGQIICVLEVMKTYHEVAAPEGGILERFNVEDGDFVEYGEVIATIIRKA